MQSLLVLIFQVNKEIEKKYHHLTGHRQSIESNPIALNKHKLYFKLNRIKFDELKQDSFLNKNINNDMELKQKKTTNSGDNITSKLIDGNIVVHGNLNISDARVSGKID